MLNQTSPWQASGLFWKFVILVLAGSMCVSCFLSVNSSNDDPPPSDTTDPDDSSKPPMPCDPISGESIAALQFEETVSAEKIPLIDELGGLEDENLQKCLQAITHKEVIALTIFDLSRHTNSELAEKAQALLERFDLAAYVDKEVDSEDEERWQGILEFLLRIEPDQAKNILEQVSFETEEADQIVEKVSNGVHRVLIPTDSESGDRYYVRVSWDPASAGQVSCLTALFNKELSTQRNLEQEGQKMKELNGNRWVYWYSKDWTLSMAESAEKCGAETAFVSGEGAQIPSVLPPEDGAPGTAEGLTSGDPAVISQAETASAPSSGGGTAVKRSGVKVTVTSHIITEGSASPRRESTPPSVPDAQPDPKPAEEATDNDVEALLKQYDDNKNGRISCTEAKNHGITPIQKDHPIYPLMRDRNRDGVVCD